MQLLDGTYSCQLGEPSLRLFQSKNRARTERLLTSLEMKLSLSCAVLFCAVLCCAVSRPAVLSRGVPGVVISVRI